MIAVRVTPGAVYLRRPVLVAASLADLRAPISGMVELPLHLYWSGTHGWFSLDDPVQMRLVYTIVLREARCPDDLAAFLDGDMLTALWPRMVLPRPVRKAWEDQHPVLRPPAAPAGLPGTGHRPAPGAAPGSCSAVAYRGSRVILSAQASWAAAQRARVYARFGYSPGVLFGTAWIPDGFRMSTEITE
jgi:hypothetical protein